jgi:hypothetical protein
MKFHPHVLLEIVAIVQKGLLNNKDISEFLRKVDVVVIDDCVDLSDEYIRSRDANEG